MSIRPAAVAGRFYPGTPDALEQTVRSLLRGAHSTQPAPDHTSGILVPHAGYPYSGPVAAHAFRRVEGKRPGRVVLLGCSHHYQFSGASIVTSGSFETPLGLLPVDAAFAAALAKDTETASLAAHEPEHALEVELPFLQVVLGPVSIVPVLFGAEPSPWHAQFGRALAARLDPGDLVIISTDLSHYLPNPEAHALDHQSLDCLLEQDSVAFQEAARSGGVSMCGATAVQAGMSCALARGATQWRLLDYRTSGDVCGERSRVVGYAAVSFEYPD